MASETDITETMQALFCALADYVGAAYTKKTGELFDEKKYTSYYEFKMGWDQKYSKEQNSVENVFDKHVKSGKASFKDLEDFIENKGKLGQEWYKSSVLIAKKLIQDIDDIDKDFSKIQKPKWSSIVYEHRDKMMNQIEEMWKQANENTKKLKKVDSKVKFIPFGDVNKWSPADIYFASPKAEKTINDSVNNKNLFEGLNFIGLNKLISDLIDSGDLLPVSLKKQTTSVHLYKVNFNKTAEWKEIQKLSFGGYVWKPYPKNPTDNPPARDLKVYLTGTQSEKDYIIFRHDPASSGSFKGEIKLEGMEARAGSLGFEQIIGIIGLVDNTLSQKIKSEFTSANNKFKAEKKPYREKYEKAIKMSGLDIKSKNKADQDKIKKIRKNVGYDKSVGYLSATLVTNKIMPIIINGMLKDQETSENFVRMTYAYAASQSKDSAKFIIAK